MANTPDSRKIISLAALSEFKTLFTQELNGSYVPYLGAESALNLGYNDYITYQQLEVRNATGGGDGPEIINYYARYKANSIVIMPNGGSNTKVLNFPSAARLANANSFTLATEEWVNGVVAGYLPLTGGVITGNNPIYFNNAYNSIRDRAQGQTIAGGLQLEGNNIILKTGGSIELEMELTLSIVSDNDNNTRFHRFDSAGDIILNPSSGRKLYYSSISDANEIVKKGDLSAYVAYTAAGGIDLGTHTLDAGFVNVQSASHGSALFSVNSSGALEIEYSNGSGDDAGTLVFPTLSSASETQVIATQTYVGNQITTALGSYVTQTALTTALGGYLPLTAGINKALTGDLYLYTTEKGQNLGVYVSSPATPNNPNTGQPYSTILKSSEATLITYFQPDNLIGGAWRSRLELASTKQNDEKTGVYYETGKIHFFNGDVEYDLVFPQLADGDVETIATESYFTNAFVSKTGDTMSGNLTIQPGVDVEPSITLFKTTHSDVLDADVISGQVVYGVDGIKYGTIINAAKIKFPTVTQETYFATQAWVTTQLGGYQTTLSAQTAYSAKGTASKVAQITTNSLGQVTAITEVDIAFPVTDVKVGTTSVVSSGVATLGTAAGQSYTSSVTMNSTELVTSGAVFAAISNLPSPMVFMGTLGTNATISSLPTATSSNVGYTYKVITDGTYAGQSAQVGDVFTCCVTHGSSDTYSWVLIPSGDDIEDTWRGISVNGTSLLGNGITSGAVNFVSGGHVTVSGSGNNITLGVESGYSIPSTTDQATWSAKQDALGYTPVNKAGDTMSGTLWLTGSSSSNRLTTSQGMPGNMQYGSGNRGTQIYANGIAFADPYHGSNANDAGWIRHLETTTNTSIFEFAAGDDGDGSEEIRFRYYNTSNNVAYDILVPRKTGTLAITDDISSAVANYLPLTGGALTGKISVCSGESNIYPNNAAIEVRELNRAGTGVSEVRDNAPKIGFHWQNRYWANMVYFNDSFEFMNDSCTGYRPIRVSEVSVNNGTMRYNATEDCIEFVFA